MHFCVWSVVFSCVRQKTLLFSHHHCVYSSRYGVPGDRQRKQWGPQFGVDAIVKYVLIGVVIRKGNSVHKKHTQRHQYRDNKVKKNLNKEWMIALVTYYIVYLLQLQSHLSGCDDLRWSSGSLFSINNAQCPRVRANNKLRLGALRMHKDANHQAVWLTMMSFDWSVLWEQLSATTITHSSCSWCGCTL